MVSAIPYILFRRSNGFIPVSYTHLDVYKRQGLGRDGYAMVGQGRIAEIVQSKSDERREIFEEAARCV